MTGRREQYSSGWPELRLPLRPLILDFPCGQRPDAGSGFARHTGSVGGGRGGQNFSKVTNGCANAFDSYAPG